MAKKKVNPNRIPVSKADVDKAKRDVQKMAISYVWAIFFTVMVDKEGYGKKRLKRIWDAVTDLCDSISKGYVKVDDLIRTLEEEKKIYLEL